MPALHLDFETASRLDLKKVGLYRYAENARILTAAWSFDGEPVRWATPDDRAGTALFEELHWRLRTSIVQIHAHNAGFERQILKQCLNLDLPPSRFRCTAARAARLALPRSLEKALAVLDLPVKKDMVGRRVMLRVTKPRHGKLIPPDDAELHVLGEYCAGDVAGEIALDKALPELSPSEQEIWELTETINDRGVPIDYRFAQAAAWLCHDLREFYDSAMREVTGGAVPKASNVHQLKRWFRSEFGTDVIESDDDETRKANLLKLLENDALPARARAAIEIRLAAGKASVKKYEAMINRATSDYVTGRMRIQGNLVYHAASTGRFGGSGVQMQNVIRDTEKDPEAVIRIAEELDADLFRQFFPQPMDTLSRTLRATVKAPVGHTLIWADYGQVEARGVAWLAGASKLVHLFASGGKVYEEMAATIFNRPVSAIEDGSFERWVGKGVVLGCGYGMGGPKFEETCLGQGRVLPPGLAQAAVDAYRTENPEIPTLWYDVGRAAVRAVGNPGGIVLLGDKLQFFVDPDREWLRIRLPSGRALWYRKPFIKPDRFGNPVLHYWAENSVTRQWAVESAWGGKLVENIVQAFCRDLITTAMLALEAYGLRPILSVHDEIICEIENTVDRIAFAKELLRVTMVMPALEWVKGFPLSVSVKEGVRYGK